MGYSELTVIVQDDRSIIARRDDGDEAGGKIELDPLHRKLIDIFENWLCQGKVSRRAEFEAFGALLYKMLFSGQVGDFFEMTLDHMPKSHRLSVQLGFQEKAADLDRLPWEFLYHPDTEVRPGFFFATSVDLALSRLIPLADVRQILMPFERPLRILIVVSQPLDLPTLMVEPVMVEPVTEAIQQLAEKYPIMVDTLDKPTITFFLDKLTSFQPHILHFIGHGRYNRAEKRSEIALLGPDEKSPAWIRDRELAEFLSQIRLTPRLVLLHAGESAALAPQLIRANVQAVIGMQYPITNQVAVTFSRAFYNELLKGETIDNAVQSGRWRTTISDPNAYDSRDFGAPVLYMRNREGIVLREASLRPEPSSRQSLRPEPEPSPRKPR